MIIIQFFLRESIDFNYLMWYNIPKREVENMGSTEKINSICKKILALTEEDFEEVLQIAKQQSEYVHPLKMETAAKQRAFGEYNKSVVHALKEAKRVIESGAGI